MVAIKFIYINKMSLILNAIKDKSDKDMNIIPKYKFKMVNKHNNLIDDLSQNCLVNIKYGSDQVPFVKECKDVGNGIIKKECKNMFGNISMLSID